MNRILMALAMLLPTSLWAQGTTIPGPVTITCSTPPCPTGLAGAPGGPVQTPAVGINQVYLDANNGVSLIVGTNAPVSLGQQGPMGPQGPAGPLGAQGVAGPVGMTGPQGVPGPVGPTGPQGPQGPSGGGGSGIPKIQVTIYAKTGCVAPNGTFNQATGICTLKNACIAIPQFSMPQLTTLNVLEWGNSGPPPTGWTGVSPVKASFWPTSNGNAAGSVCTLPGQTVSFANVEMNVGAL